jgi:hypothetical protein
MIGSLPQNVFQVQYFRNYVIPVPVPDPFYLSMNQSTKILCFIIVNGLISVFQWP